MSKEFPQLTGLILIGDDVPTHLKVLLESLGGTGCKVSIATSGARGDSMTQPESLRYQQPFKPY